MKRLARKSDYLGLKNVRTILQSAEAIDLPDASVDLIVRTLDSITSIGRTKRSTHAFASPSPPTNCF